MYVSHLSDLTIGNYLFNLVSNPVTTTPKRNSISHYNAVACETFLAFGTKS